MMLGNLHARAKVPKCVVSNILRCSQGTHINSSTRSNSNKTPSLEKLNAEKAAAKQRRTDRYNAKKERLEKYRTVGRRDEEKKNFLKNQFHNWYNATKSRQAWMNREAKRNKMDWKIRVGIMLERLPVVTPDEEQWEKDYERLRFELDRYGPVFPKEFKMGDPMDAVWMTDEELEGKFLLVPVASFSFIVS